jgi:hypothetical protein
MNQFFYSGRPGIARMGDGEGFHVQEAIVEEIQ